jgi:hypothetical protein
LLGDLLDEADYEAQDDTAQYICNRGPIAKHLKKKIAYVVELVVQPVVGEIKFI